MNSQIDPCYLCDRFKRRENLQPSYGHCEGFDKPRRYDETNEACVLWNRARNEAQRKRWAEQQNNQRESASSEVPT